MYKQYIVYKIKRVFNKRTSNSDPFPVGGNWKGDTATGVKDNIILLQYTMYIIRTRL
jgi:hypothetical protein